MVPLNHWYDNLLQNSQNKIICEKYGSKPKKPCGEEMKSENPQINKMLPPKVLKHNKKRIPQKKIGDRSREGGIGQTTRK